MKTPFLLLSFAVALSTQAQVSPLNGSGAGGSTGKPTDYLITDRGPNHRVWSRVVLETTPSGEPRARTNSYTELATGMHRSVNGKWVESSAQLQITATGARATNSQHQVAFLGNLNAPGAVDITLPEGGHLIGNVLGLSYLDTVS